MIKKLALTFLFSAKRFVGLFPKKYDDDVVQCKGKAGDVFVVNTEAWHTGRRLSVDGKGVMLWNYIYGDGLSTWVNHLSRFKFLKN